MSERKPEDEYFAKLDAEKRQKIKAQVEAESVAAQHEAERQLHWHRCGKCGAAMDTHVFRGTDIEICPRCGAVLLDSGELEALAGTDKSGVIQGILDLFGGSKPR